MKGIKELAKVAYGFFKKNKKHKKGKPQAASRPTDFLSSKGYNMRSDILVMPKDHPLMLDGRVRGGKIIFLEVKAPAIIREGYSGNRGTLW